MYTVATGAGVNKNNTGRLCNQRSILPSNLQGKISKPSKVDSIRIRGIKKNVFIMHNERETPTVSGRNAYQRAFETLILHINEDVLDKKKHFSLLILINITRICYVEY